MVKKKTGIVIVIVLVVLVLLTIFVFVPMMRKKTDGSASKKSQQMAYDSATSQALEIAAHQAATGQTGQTGF